MPRRKRKPRIGYARDWPAYNAARRHRKRHFRLLLRELCDCVEQPEQLLGRPRVKLSDVIYCLVLNVFNKFDARGGLGDADDAFDMGLLSCVPHYNTLGRYLREDWLTPILERLIELASLPLVPFERDFAADATGFSTDRYARWVEERTSQELSSREWVKVHLICGVKTHVVPWVIVRWGHESRFFGRLVAETARNFRMEEVSADAGYISGENMRHALLAGATPYIAFKSNCRVDADYKSMIWKRMLAMFQDEHWRFRAHYNKRNNVESVFSMIKANFNDYLRSRTERARVNEALAKVLCHNLCVLIHAIYELGIAPKFDAMINPDEEAKREPTKPEPVASGRIVAGGKKATPWPEGKRRKKNPQRKSAADLNQLSLFGAG